MFLEGFCFFPAGDVAVMRLVSSGKHLYEGKQAQGRAHGKTAKLWAGVRRSKTGRIDFYVVVA